MKYSGTTFDAIPFNKQSMRTHKFPYLCLFLLGYFDILENVIHSKSLSEHSTINQCEGNHTNPQVQHTEDIVNFRARDTFINSQEYHQ